MYVEFDSGFAETAAGYCPSPAKDSEERFNRLRLIRSRRVGPSTYRRLMAEHGNAAASLAALPDVAAKAGVSTYTPCPEGVIRAEFAAARRMGARLLCLGDRDYPSALLDVPDAPPLIWALGRIDLLARPTIALVGTRNASSLGARMARKLSGDLSDAGYIVVSGLARGIDALAHTAALGGGTIGVQAGGLDVLYPAENTDLFHDLAQKGLRLTEQPFGLQPQARHFPRRNRIISGLAQAVVVVEAAARSGSMITARNALDQGREVLAVPGHPMDARAGGCNLLIRDGATLVRNASDVIEALGPLAQPDRPLQSSLPLSAPNAPPEVPKGTPERDWRDRAALNARILDQLGPSPVSEDQLLRDIGAPAPDAAATLAALELEGEVERQPGGLIMRAVKAGDAAAINPQGGAPHKRR